jgi:23S rRNA (uracil1939-C5)-methyltransferase
LLLSIEKLIYGGDGLARTPTDTDGRSMAVFVPFVLPGERVEAEARGGKSFSRGTLSQVVDASPDRIAALCPYFERCGGCHYQHIPYQRQLEFKAAILRETLQRVGRIDLHSEIRLHPSPPFNYRNRTRLRVRSAPEFELGYFRFGSHEFLPVQQCPISSPLINKTLARLLELRGLDCPAAVEEIEFFSDAEDEHLLVWAYCVRDADSKQLTRWSQSMQTELTAIAGVTCFGPRPGSKQTKENFDDDEASEGKRVTQAGAIAIRYRTKEFEYRVSAGAFFQVNRHLIDGLVSVVTGDAGGERAIDFYAGVGLFSSVLARNFHHILGVEASQTAYADFVQNVPANVKAVGARTEDFLTNDYSGNQRGRNRPDLVVLDPPRAGAGKKVIKALVQLGAPRVRYVSCDPATLARDLAQMLAAGYRIEEAHLFDLFPQTFHIESVMLLAR